MTIQSHPFFDGPALFVSEASTTKGHVEQPTFTEERIARILKKAGFPYSPPAEVAHAEVDLNHAVAGQIRVRVGELEFSKWYSIHTQLDRILNEAFGSEILAPLKLSLKKAVLMRVDLEIGLIEVEPQQPSVTKSLFQQQLDADPELRERCEKIAQSVREVAANEVRACSKSEQLTREDLWVVINATPENSLH